MTQPSPSTEETRAITLVTRRANLIIAAIVTLVAVAAIYVAKDFPSTGQPTDPGASRFPVIYGVVLIVLSGLLVLDTLRRPIVPPAEELGDGVVRRRIVNVATGVVLMILGVTAMSWVGYLPATALYLALAMGAMGLRHPLLNPVLAVALTALLWVAFSKGLEVPLPVGSLFE